MFLTALKGLNLALAFLLELGVLAALCYWGLLVNANTLVRVVLGVGAPILAIVVWSIWGAQKAKRRLQGGAFLLLRIVFFGSAVVALFAAGQPLIAMIFAVAVVVNLVLIYVWKQG